VGTDRQTYDETNSLLRKFCFACISKRDVLPTGVYITKRHFVYHKSYMNWTSIVRVPLVIQYRNFEVTQYFEIIGFSKLFLPVSKHQLFVCCSDHHQLSPTLRCVVVGPSVCNAVWWLDLLASVLISTGRPVSTDHLLNFPGWFSFKISRGCPTFVWQGATPFIAG